MFYMQHKILIERNKDCELDFSQHFIKLSSNVLENLCNTKYLSPVALCCSSQLKCRTTERAKRRRFIFKKSSIFLALHNNLSDSLNFRYFSDFGFHFQNSNYFSIIIIINYFSLYWIIYVNSIIHTISRIVGLIIGVCSSLGMGGPIPPPNA